MKEKFLNLLRGFFSIVIIDHKTNKIFACVDQYSVKPLYYFHSEDLLIFASNLSPILNNKFTGKNYDQKELTKSGTKVLFPFVKEIVEDITRRGGSMPVSLNEVDFNLIKN